MISGEETTQVGGGMEQGAQGGEEGQGACMAGSSAGTGSRAGSGRPKEEEKCNELVARSKRSGRGKTREPEEAAQKRGPEMSARGESDLEHEGNGGSGRLGRTVVGSSRKVTRSHGDSGSEARGSRKRRRSERENERRRSTNRHRRDSAKNRSKEADSDSEAQSQSQSQSQSTQSESESRSRSDSVSDSESESEAGSRTRRRRARAQSHSSSGTSAAHSRANDLAARTKREREHRKGERREVKRYSSSDLSRSVGATRRRHRSRRDQNAHSSDSSHGSSTSSSFSSSSSRASSASASDASSLSSQSSSYSSRDRRRRRRSEKPQKSFKPLYEKRRATFWHVRQSPYGFPLPSPDAVAEGAGVRTPLSRLDKFDSRYDDTPRLPLKEARDQEGMMRADSGRGSASAGISAGARDQNTRHARRIYVGNLPTSATEQTIIAFLTDAMIRSGGSESERGCVLNAYVNSARRFAFIEFRTTREAAAALCMDGILLEGMSLRVRRPNDFLESEVGVVHPPDAFDVSTLGIVSTMVSESSDKMFVGGIPYRLSEDEIKELLQSFGPLKSFNLIKDSSTGMSKGFAFFEYEDSSIIDQAIAGLDGMRVGDRSLTVRRSGDRDARPVGSSAGPPISPSATPVSQDIGVPEKAKPPAPTRVLELRNMLRIEELKDDAEYEDIFEDVSEEAKNYGEVTDIYIPRPPRDNGAGGSEPSPAGLGRVFIVFKNVEDCARASAALSGRKFDGRPVITTFVSVEKFERREL